MYNAVSRIRKIDGVDSAKSLWNDDEYDNTPKIIDHPEKFLLTQDEIFDAEGGWLGLGLQLGAITTSLIGLRAYRPNVFKYLLKGNMNYCEWLWLGGTVFVAHRFALASSTQLFGNPQTLQDHWMAYTL